MNRERTLEVLFPRQDQRCDRDGNDERSVTNLDPSTSEKAEPDAETGDLRRALANTSANTPMEASSRETHRTVSLGRGDSKRDLPSQDISDSKVICVICLERIGTFTLMSCLVGSNLIPDDSNPGLFLTLYNMNYYCPTNIKFYRRVAKGFRLVPTLFSL